MVAVMVGQSGCGEKRLTAGAGQHQIAKLAALNGVLKDIKRRGRGLSPALAHAATTHNTAACSCMRLAFALSAGRA
jgi:hypothetical protein